jgi:hypothetical protein
LSLGWVPLEDLVVSLGGVVTALEDPEGAIDTYSEVLSANSVVVFTVGAGNSTIRADQDGLFLEESKSTIVVVCLILNI